MFIISRQKNDVLTGKLLPVYGKKRAVSSWSDLLLLPHYPWRGICWLFAMDNKKARTILRGLLTYKKCFFMMLYVVQYLPDLAGRNQITRVQREQEQR